MVDAVPGESQRLAVVGTVLLCLTPVVILPGALDRFTLPKLAVAAAGAACILLGSSKGTLHRDVAAVLIPCMALVLVAATASDLPILTALIGRAPRFEGCATLFVYVACLAAGARVWAESDRGSTFATAAPILAWGAVAAVAVELLSRAGLTVLSSDVTRAGSLLGNATDFGALGVLLLPLFLVMAVTQGPRQRRTRYRYLAAMVAASGCVILSGSRAAVAGAIVALAVLVVANWRSVRWWALSAAGLLIAGSLLISTTRERLTGESPLAGSTVTGRALLWRETVRLIANHPVVGVGPSQFETAIVGYHDPRWYAEVGPANPPDSPHNLLLQAAAVGGLALLGATLVLGGIFCWLGVRQVRDERAPARGRKPAIQPQLLASALLAGVLGYLVIMVTYFTDPLTTPLAAWLAGGIVAGGAGASSLWPARTMGGICAVVALVATVGAGAEIPLRLAVEAASHGDLSQANDYFRAAEHLRPWDGDLAATAGHVLVTAGQGRLGSARLAAVDAAPWLSAARRWAPGDEQVALDTSTRLELLKEFTPALATIEAQVRLDPHNPELSLREGVLYAELGQLARALVTLHRSAAMDPTSAAPWLDIAHVYRLDGQAQKAAVADHKAAALAEDGHQ